MTPEQNSSNQQNANKGTSGSNTQYDKVQANKGKQLATKQGGKGGGKSSASKGAGKR